MTHVKVCGVTRVSDALRCAELGVSAIGVSFVTGSPRAVSVARAREISRAVSGSKVLVVGVVANLDVTHMRALVTDAELGCLELRGDEAPETLTPLLPHAYKALRLRSADALSLARSFPGDYILAHTATLDVTLAAPLIGPLARERRLTLAGGLRPNNVARAIAAFTPWCVHAESGIEYEPGVKDPDAVAAFVAQARV